MKHKSIALWPTIYVTDRSAIAKQAVLFLPVFINHLIPDR